MNHGKASVAAFTTVLTTVLLAAAGWACVAGPSAFTSTVNVKAGEQLGVEAVDFDQTEIPVLVRFGELDGPVLADLGLPDGDRDRVAGTVTIPEGTPPGNYVLIFTQTGPGGEMVQTPVRALVTVVGEAGAAPMVGAELGAADTTRTPGLATDDSSISAPALVLLAVGVAGVGMLLAGGAAMLASRRQAARSPEHA